MRLAVTVEFDPSVLDDLRRLVAERQAVKREAVRTQKHDAAHSDAEVELLGMMGEQAVSALLGVPWSRAHHAGGDPGYDLTYAGTVRIAVRTTFHANGRLLMMPSDPLHWQVAVLVVAGAVPEAVRLVGWIERAAFRTHATRDDLGYGPRLVMPQDVLRPMTALLWYLGRCVAHGSRAGTQRRG